MSKSMKKDILEELADLWSRINFGTPLSGQESDRQMIIRNSVAKNLEDYESPENYLQELKKELYSNSKCAFCGK